MKKSIYKSYKINQIDWAKQSELFTGLKIILAVDVAKSQQYALLADTDHQHSVLIQWHLLDETALLIQHLKNLNAKIEVVMESTSTYGDALRYQCQQAGFAVFQVSAKRVHDAREIYDGVPSLHDAKSAWLIAKLHKEGMTKPWLGASEQERQFNAMHLELELYQNQYRGNLNRLEAHLSRYWPEVLCYFELSSVTLEQLVLNYGSAQQVAGNAEQAALDMRLWGRQMLTNEKIAAVIEGAKTSIGTVANAAEIHYLKALAKELEHARLQAQTAQKALEKQVECATELGEMVATIGKVTTAVLVGNHLDPRLYDNPKSYQKALGLNLTEKSSGQLKGRARISKRGSSLARWYLYMATLRLIGGDPIISAWYNAKKDDKAKLKTVVALMRKLSLALWHVACGAVFAPEKLFKNVGLAVAH